VDDAPLPTGNHNHCQPARHHSDNFTVDAWPFYYGATATVATCTTNPTATIVRLMKASTERISMAEPYLGFGLGLRTQHFHDILEQRPAVDWFEVISENFMVAGGKPKHYLHRIREHYPIVMHGVSLSVGTTDPLNTDYLKRLKVLINEIQPPWISDHLCWTQVGATNSHDLLPLPYTEEAINHVADRISQVQDILGRQMLIENVSSYLTYKDSAIPEWEFLTAVTDKADCKILLDVNNIYVSARNHDFNPLEYLNAINPDRVQQFHLAGHTDYGTYIIDTHDHDVPDPVWELYRAAVKRFGLVSAMIERDDDIPSLEALVGELGIARKIAAEARPDLYDDVAEVV